MFYANFDQRYIISFLFYFYRHFYDHCRLLLCCDNKNFTIIKMVINITDNSCNSIFSVQLFCNLLAVPTKPSFGANSDLLLITFHWESNAGFLILINSHHNIKLEWMCGRYKWLSDDWWRVMAMSTWRRRGGRRGG